MVVGGGVLGVVRSVVFLVVVDVGDVVVVDAVVVTIVVVVKALVDVVTVSVDAAVVKVVVDVVIELFVEVAVVVIAAAASEVIVVVSGVDVVSGTELFIRVIRSIRLTVKVFVSSSSIGADELSPNAVALITKTLVFPLSTTTW